jgi:Flp pilus assembly protein TadG
MSGPERLGRLARGDDTGAATTVSLVLMLPVLTLLLFAAVQAALWNHARTEARAMARSTAALVARSGANPADVERDAEANLANRSDLEEVDVTVTVTTAGGGGGTVVVRVIGNAPGIVIGTTSSVDVEIAMPIEGWSSL